MPTVLETLRVCVERRAGLIEITREFGFGETRSERRIYQERACTACRQLLADDDFVRQHLPDVLAVASWYAAHEHAPGSNGDDVAARDAEQRLAAETDHR